MNIVARKEKKFLISIDNYYKYTDYISKILNEDTHNGVNGYNIRSLYFDTIDDMDFEDKEAGIETRRKIRLRIYNPNDSFALLEIKQKQGDNQLKRSVRLSKEDAYSLINKQYSVLLRYSDELALELYTIMNTRTYLPKTIVEYKRKAFITKENSIRITFDNDIRATEVSYDIFDKNLMMYPVIDNYNAILEVKYTEFLLSYIKDALRLSNQSELSVSKYMLARNIGKNYNIRF